LTDHARASDLYPGFYQTFGATIFGSGLFLNALLGAESMHMRQLAPTQAMFDACKNNTVPRQSMKNNFWR